MQLLGIEDYKTKMLQKIISQAGRKKQSNRPGSQKPQRNMRFLRTTPLLMKKVRAAGEHVGGGTVRHCWEHERHTSKDHVATSQNVA